MYKLTIIIATYNAGKTLKQALDSIKYQSFENIELIVVDGLSSDNTIDIINEYKDVVTKFISEHDTGIYNAFNKGLDLATGDYVCFLGADDCYCDYEVLEKVVQEFNDDFEVVSAPIKIVNEYTLKQGFMNNRLSKEEVLSGMMIPHPGLFVRLSVMKKYYFNESNRIISDYEFLVRFLLDGGEIKFIDVPVVFFSTSGISSNGFESDFWKLQLYEHFILLEKLGLKKDYLYPLCDRMFNTSKKSIGKYRFKELFKIICNCIGVSLVIDKLCLFLIKFMGRKKHRCKLKYCRWCNRY